MPLANAISAHFPALPLALPLGTAAILAALTMPAKLYAVMPTIFLCLYS